MISVNNNIVICVIDGQLTLEKMESLISNLHELSKSISNGKIKFVFNKYKNPTAKAMLFEIKKLPTIFKIFSSFSKVAVVSTDDFLLKISAMEGHLFPHLQLKTFTVDDEANEWLED